MRKLIALFGLLLALGPATALAQANPNTINDAVDAYNRNDLARAALLFYEAKMTDTAAANRAKAEYYLGQSLFKLGLYQSALAFFNAVFVAGPAHPYYLKGAEGLINVAQALKDDTLIPSQINKYYNSQGFATMDPMALSRINFYVGLLLYRQEKYGDAMAFLGAVDPKSAVYAKSLFLQAIIHTKIGVRFSMTRDEARSQAEYDAAIKLFEQILDLSGREASRARQALATYDDIQRIWQLCTLNLARAFYGKGDYAKATVYYARIPRFSRDWADALFEIGWGYFMRQEFGKALGALHTLHSPYFGDLFHPESWILRATIYFQACLYDESKVAIKHFEDNYVTHLPLLKELTQGALPPEAFASLLLKDQLAADDPMSKVPAFIRASIMENPRVENFRHFLRSLEAEAKAIDEASEWKGTRLQQELAGVVSVQRTLLEKTAGGFVKANLMQTYQTIFGMITQAKMVSLEITSRERLMAKANLPLSAEDRGKLSPRPKTPDETYNYWPFRQEYWEDELGFYEYTVRLACPKELE